MRKGWKKEWLRIKVEKESEKVEKAGEKEREKGEKDAKGEQKWWKSANLALKPT